MRPVVALALPSFAALALLAGCGRSVASPAPTGAPGGQAVPDDLSGWQARPLAPDAALSEAAGIDEDCQARPIPLNATQPPPLQLPMQVLLQDRRTERTAGFVVATAGYVGACLLTPVGWSQGHLLEAPLAPLPEAVGVEGMVGGLLGSDEGIASFVWGQADARVASVTLDIAPELHVFDDDDRVVTASVGGGYWFGWWPAGGTPAVVTGLDAQGNTVVSIRQTDQGWLAQ